MPVKAKKASVAEKPAFQEGDCVQYGNRTDLKYKIVSKLFLEPCHPTAEVEMFQRGISFEYLQQRPEKFTKV